MIEVFMPKAGMDMKEGTLIRWLKEVGDPVELDEPIMEIETDKITMEAESPGSGILLSKIVEEGSVVPVLSVLGYIGNEGEQPPQKAMKVLDFESKEPGTGGHPAPAAPMGAFFGAQAAEIASMKPVPATPYAKKLARERGIDLHEAAREIGVRGVIRGKDLLATPLAKRVAEANQVDLAQIAGSGKHGRITREDVEEQMQKAVEEHMEKQAQKPVEESVTTQAQMPVETGQNPFRTVECRQKLRGVRKVVGKRMFESYSQVPTVMQSMKVDMTELLDFRRKLNEGREQKISLNDLLIKATAIAVKELPHVRTMVEGDELVTYEEANIGFAVAVEDGLYVPVIRNADRLSVGEISRQAKELAKKAREGTIRPDEFSGGTFSISNMGMFDVYTFNPIINQPESGILGITGIEDVPKIVDGQVAVRKEAVLCMSYDHRVMDGVGAARLKKRVKELVEHPIDILI